MWTKRNCIILAVMLLWSISSYSQESRSEVFVDFRINSIRIDQAYGNNAERLREITDILQGVLNDPAVEIIQLSFCGTASPEGSYQLNKKLAQGRLEALEKWCGKKWQCRTASSHATADISHGSILSKWWKNRICPIRRIF